MKSICKILFLLLLIQRPAFISAQEFAMDFTRTDCKGVEHHLFSELDEGKVVVLDFVMLGCAPCIWATKDIDTIVNAYSLTHPGRVEVYAFSYDSIHTCDQMFEWRTLGGFPDVLLFTQGHEMVDYYGGIGMPTIVVTGSSLHKVFYNGYGYTSADDSLINAAISNALIYDQSGEEDKESAQNMGFRVYPTLFTDRICIETAKEFPGAEILVYDTYGRQVLSSAVTAKGRQYIATLFLSKGIYFARFKTGIGLSGCVKLIRQ